MYFNKKNNCPKLSLLPSVEIVQASKAMNLLSASSSSSSSPCSNSSFTLFSHSQSQNHNHSSSYFNVAVKTPRLSPFLAHQSPSPPVLQRKPRSTSPNEEISETIGSQERITVDKDPLNELLVRRPVMEDSSDDEEEQDEIGNGDRERSDQLSSSSPIDASLSKFAKKMPIFEPGRVELSSEERPLKVNLDLALYKAKVLARNFQYEESEDLLLKCIYYWPEDGRPYVALGKILSKQSRVNEVRAVYEKGCQATEGENPYIWQCWAVLEARMGNTRKARELFDAATVADKKHIAAWHAWAILELKQGNVKKARNLLSKGVKFCGGNEYVYQTLALLEAKANRYDQARYLFNQATKCNPKSCASWLAWAQLELQQENNNSARKLFEKSVQASPKNRFAWHVWGVFESKLGNVVLGRKLLKIGHVLNPRDPVLLQSLGLLEYKYSGPSIARVIFKKAAELDPRHQPVWIGWGWMEWKEGKIARARELYQRALAIDCTTESAARCLQAWGVLEQRIGNMSAARRLFRSSLNINSQSYVTWTTWAKMEEDQGNSIRAEEIRNLYFQQRTEVVDDASWVMGLLDFFDPAVDSIKRLLKLDKNTGIINGTYSGIGTGKEGAEQSTLNASGFDLDSFLHRELFIDPAELDTRFETSLKSVIMVRKNPPKIWKSSDKSSSNLLSKNVM